jgi:hypothetical protein
MCIHSRPTSAAMVPTRKFLQPSGSQSYSTALRCHPVLAPRIGSVWRRNIFGEASQH